MGITAVLFWFLLGWAICKIIRGMVAGGFLAGSTNMTDKAQEQGCLRVVQSIGGGTLLFVLAVIGLLTL